MPGLIPTRSKSRSTSSASSAFGTGRPEAFGADAIRDNLDAIAAIADLGRLRVAWADSGLVCHGQAAGFDHTDAMGDRIVRGDSHSPVWQWFPERPDVPPKVHMSRFIVFDAGGCTRIGLVDGSVRSFAGSVAPRRNEGGSVVVYTGRRINGTDITIPATAVDRHRSAGLTAHPARCHAPRPSTRSSAGRTPRIG